MKKIISIILSLCILACGFMFTGCAKNTPPDTVVIVLDSKLQDVYGPMFSKFTADTGYKVDARWNADPFKLQDTMRGSGECPDIIVGGDMHLKKYALDLYDLSFLKEDAEYDFADLIPEVVNPLYIDGKLGFVPRFFNSSLLYYNTDLIKGDNIPTNDWKYQDFYNAAKSITNIQNNVNNGNDNTYGCTQENYYWGEWMVHIRQEGGEVMNSSNLKMSMTSAATKRGLARFAAKTFGSDSGGNLVTSGAASGRTYALQPNRIAPDVQGADKPYGGFESKRYGFVFGGHTANIPVYRKVEGLNFDVALLPKTEIKNDDGVGTGEFSRAGGELAIDALGIYKGTGSLEAAKAFIKYMTGKEGIKMHSDAGYVAVRNSVKNILLAVPKAERPQPQNLEAIYDSLNFNQPLPTFDFFVNLLTEEVQPELSKLMSNTQTVDTTATEANRRGNGYINMNT